MPTKLERARDATLAKYDGFLEEALDNDIVSSRLEETSCAFCQEFASVEISRGLYCSPCPIFQDESDKGHRWYYDKVSPCFDPVLVPIIELIDEGDAVPAILAAMIYLHGFKEE